MTFCANEIDLPIAAIQEIDHTPGIGTLITLDVNEATDIVRCIGGRLKSLSLFIWDGLHDDQPNSMSLVFERTRRRPLFSLPSESYDLTTTASERHTASLMCEW